MIQAQQLERVTWQCVHFGDADDVMVARNELSQNVRIVEVEFEVDGQVPDQIGIAFHFPNFFGGNWDALEECLRDLSWLPAPAYVLFFKRSHDLFTHDPYAAGNLIESWLLAAEEWAKDKVPFHLVFIW